MERGYHMPRCFYCNENHYSGKCLSANIVGSPRKLVNFMKIQHAEIMWQMEKQLEVLTGIYDCISHPEITRSNDLLEIGIKCLKLGLIQESMQKLNEAVKCNPLDYRTYIAMGHVYIQMGDPKNALDRFEYSYKTARTNYYQSYSLLLISRVYFCMGNLDDAIKAIKLAINISPEEPEFHYSYSTYLAQKLNI